MHTRAKDVGLTTLLHQVKAPLNQRLLEGPNASFKVIYNKKGDTAAFMMQQSSERNDDYCQKAVTLAEVQEAIDFKLLNTLHVDQEIYSRLDCQQ